MIHNPILKGFHPDPSIVRVGEDYYIATSTFEWWPGIRLHHSTDLVHWELIEYPLNRTSQLDLRNAGQRRCAYRNRPADLQADGHRPRLHRGQDDRPAEGMHPRGSRPAPATER